MKTEVKNYLISNRTVMKNLKTIITLFTLILITSCSKDNDVTELSQINVTKNKIFVAGSEVINTKVVPVIWIDGVKTTLSSEAGSNTDALAVFVQDNDVYIIGKEELAKKSLVLWKNGLRSRVSSLAAFVAFKELVVNNGNVYVLGIETIDNGLPFIKYWKNGVAVDIVPSITAGKENRAENMVVVNNDVYVSGFENNATATRFTAKFWKNGVPTTIGSGTQNSLASSIVVDATSVSVLFTEISNSTLRNEVKLWKDNNISLIATSVENIEAKYMSVKDNVRHILMSENTATAFGKLIYLKDNVRTEITAGGVSNDFIKMQVDGTNVCIAYNENAIGKYWINGVTKTLAGVLNTKTTKMFLSNADVYSLVRGFAKALFLKNGTPSDLPFDQNTQPITADVFVKK